MQLASAAANNSDNCGQWNLFTPTSCDVMFSFVSGNTSSNLYCSACREFWLVQFGNNLDPAVISSLCKNRDCGKLSEEYYRGSVVADRRKYARGIVENRLSNR